MSRRSGSADLPLHGGRVPRWLATRMAALGRLIVEALVIEFGRDEVLRRLAHPFWFQSLGCVMGMDWHSSGITTSVVSALKRGLEPVEEELGLFVCGGRGRRSRLTPEELVSVGERTGLDGDALASTSRLVAKVDSAAVQDGHQLYLHAFIVSSDGKWTVVQQGMNDATSTARRYHWLSDDVTDFVDEPHSFIQGAPLSAGGEGTVAEVINLTDRRARDNRDAQKELVQRPDAVVAEVYRLQRHRARSTWPPSPSVPHCHMPAHHDVRPKDVRLPRLHAALRAAADRGPTDFAELLMTPGVGARTVETLAMVAEVVYGAPHRFDDPARFSMALGGKDGHPFPVPLSVYDRTLDVMRRAIDAAKLGQRERIEALERLDRQARALEGRATGTSLDEHIGIETARSPAYGGRTVLGPATGAPVSMPAIGPPANGPRPVPPPRASQLELFRQAG